MSNDTASKDGPGPIQFSMSNTTLGEPSAGFGEQAVKWKLPREGRCIEQAEESRGVAARLEHVLEFVRNPSKGEPYTNAEVARMTLGDLSEEDVERIRAGAVRDPSVGQVAALASVFGVEPSYLLDYESSPLLDEELVQALGDGDVRDITRESSRLPDRERQLVLGIVRQFREQTKVPIG